ncbi:hypothetical protein PUNSTDRAFT_128865 [Punctularia strigosozonata HHB-11173 SS5]|uniref:uncharacterized protein n=1 Tax=Punctularia strigosozonata (strain HHB-11173) TaxID=741275 RepID=UPI00044182A8|nr:uncharacterized protein PUNSTDRAFT_128865 [Punctularia strigosozonata HHB-11173 SS5]EIN13177.1 hypothetical protein PUNSTDRAFT_128865 [Punctularia strigosozonata HHB-11173 SS5]
MHRVLLLQDTVEQIVDFIISYKGTTECRDLLGFALTCKTLSEVALSALWAKVQDFHRLLRLIPAYEDSGEGTWKFTRPLEKHDLSRFVYYSRRVKELYISHTGTRMDLHSIFEYFRAFEHDIELFPRVRFLCFDAYTFHGPDALLMIKSHLHSQLEILWINIAMATRSIHLELPELIRELSRTPPPRLTTITMPQFTFTPLTAKLLAQITSLRKLTIAMHPMTGEDSLDSLDALGRLWHLPLMMDLSVYLQGTSVLADADSTPDIISYERPSVAHQAYYGSVRVLHTLASRTPDAQRLKFIAFTNGTGDEWDAVFDALFQRRTETLQALIVQDLQNQASLPPATAMLRMPKFGSLRDLTISLPYDWTDEVIEHIARSCPALTYLNLLYYYSGSGRKVSTTSSALLSLALMCAQLESLHIHVNPTRQPSSPPVNPQGFDGNLSVVNLEIRFLPAFSPRPSFERFAKSLFPGLQSLVVGNA